MTGGEHKGTLALSTPYHPLAMAAALAGQAAFGKALIDALPGWREGLRRAHTLNTRNGGLPRHSMPRVEEADLAELGRAFGQSSVAEIPLSVILPTQREIWVDKALRETARSGVQGTRRFLASSHLVLTDDLHLLDGHHRWLSAHLLGLAHVPAFVLHAGRDAVLPRLLAFGDARHARNA